MKRGEVILTILRVPADFALLILAGAFVYVLRVRILDAWWPVLFGPELPFDRYVGMVVVVAALFVLVYAVAGLYMMGRRMSRLEETGRVVVASSGAMMLIILVIFLRAELFNSRFLVVGYWLSAMAAVVIGRAIIRSVYRYVSVRSGFGMHRVLLIGHDDMAEVLSRAIADDPALGYRIIGHLNDPRLPDVARVVADPGVDEVVLADPDYPADRIVQLVDFCHDRHIRFSFVPNIHRTLTTHWDVDAIGRTPIVSLRRTALDGWGKVFKRLFDISASALALLILSPVFAVVAFAIKWETAGPVLVRLRRVSRSREFDMYKFRSMIENAEELKPLLIGYNERTDGPLFKMHEDPRVTKVGRLIRRWRLDELPQFINVLRGDISLVGPRPHQPDEIARYQKHHKKVLAIKAGATGLAQASGASDLPFEEEVVLDTFYIENWSLWLDLRIILKTAARMLRGSAV
ncbi:MAG TPA: sugar transferase [Candidatus Paceibacterota bacterium]|nr:sugar transferase [Candidatus Paceibacterota bacterium]